MRGDGTSGERANRQRFREVVLPHLDDALSLARWLTGNITDAEDVVQEACVRAYAAIATAEHSNPRAWLLAIVRNTAFTWLAKNRPKAVVVTDDDRLFERAGLEMIDVARRRRLRPYSSPRSMPSSCTARLPRCLLPTASRWSCARSRA